MSSLGTERGVAGFLSHGFTFSNRQARRSLAESKGRGKGREDG